MVLITDGGPNHSLHAYVSKTAGNMTTFVAAAQPSIVEHPPGVGNQLVTGDWANYQIAFIPDGKDRVVGVAYTLYTAQKVYSQRHKAMMLG